MPVVVLVRAHGHAYKKRWFFNVSEKEKKESKKRLLSKEEIHTKRRRFLLFRTVLESEGVVWLSAMPVLKRARRVALLPRPRPFVRFVVESSPHAVRALVERPVLAYIRGLVSTPNTV